MPDSLAERLKKLAEQQAKGQAAEHEVRSLQERVNAFISDNARPEYDRLQLQLQKRINEVNPDIGDLPPFQFNPGTRMIQQGNCVAFLNFDKPILNGPQNQLMISFGPHPHNIYFDEPPPATRYRLHAAATDSVDSIVWVGDLGELTSAQLSDFILEHLTQYYLEHKPK
jgi:hypothetical protein